MRKYINIVKEILTDLCSSKCLPGLSVGFVVGLMAIVSRVSFVSMIFADSLLAHLQQGVGMVLAGSVFLLVISSFFSRIRTMICLPQDIPSALFAGVAAGIAAGHDAGDGQTAFITVTAALVCSALLTGGIFLCVGHFRLAQFFRFIPYPVVGGFLAGTGWLVIKAGLEMTTSVALSFGTLTRFTSSELLPLWLPAAGLALFLFLFLRWRPSFYVLPVTFAAAVVLYHITLGLLNIPMDEAMALGLFFSPFTESALWPVFSLEDFLHVDWPLVFGQLPTILVIPFISLIGMILNTEGVEMAIGREIDINQEFRITGAANALGGLSGSPPGYNVLTYTLMAFRAGAETRLVGLTAAVLLTLTLFFGGNALAYFPKILLGGFLILMGLFFFFDWLVDTLRKMPIADYSVLWAVFLVICVFGFIHGVVFGLLATVFLFVIRISHSSVLHSVRSGSQLRSLKGRSLPQKRLLAKHGDRIAVYELEGYVFFGSVTRLISRISLGVGDVGRKRPAIIILDFTKVIGFDISAVNNFVLLFNKFMDRGISFAICSPPKRFPELLAEHARVEKTRMLHFFPHLENALQWAEDRLLKQEEWLLASASNRGRQAREVLFDEVSEDLLSDLRKREKVESLMDRLDDRLVRTQYEPGRVILAKGSLAQGLYMVKEGVVAEVTGSDSDRNIRLQALVQGSAFGGHAACSPWIAPFTYIAESRVDIRILTPQALESLETENPALALEVFHLITEII